MNRLYSMLLMLMFLTACEDQLEEANFDFGYDFFPLQLGQHKIYQVTEINYNAQGGDTSRYFLKETITDTLQSNGVASYLVQREKSMGDTLDWQVSDIWTTRRDEQVVVVTEENIPFIKMSFPVLDGKEWDGNAFNTLTRHNYKYEQAEASAAEGIETEMIRVVISDIPQNLVNQDQRYEIYARGVGLIEKNYTILEFCTTNCSSEVINSGLKLEQVLIYYGED